MAIFQAWVAKTASQCERGPFIDHRIPICIESQPAIADSDGRWTHVGHIGDKDTRWRGRQSTFIAHNDPEAVRIARSARNSIVRVRVGKGE